MILVFTYVALEQLVEQLDRLDEKPEKHVGQPFVLASQQTQIGQLGIQSHPLHHPDGGLARRAPRKTGHHRGQPGAVGALQPASANCFAAHGVEPRLRQLFFRPQWSQQHQLAVDHLLHALALAALSHG